MKLFLHHLVWQVSPSLLPTGQAVSEQEKINDGSWMHSNTKLRFTARWTKVCTHWLPFAGLHSHPLYIRKESQCISSPSLSKRKCQNKQQQSAPSLDTFSTGHSVGDCGRSQRSSRLLNHHEDYQGSCPRSACWRPCLHTRWGNHSYMLLDITKSELRALKSLQLSLTKIIEF